MSEILTILHTIAGLKRNSGGTSSVVPFLCEGLGRIGASVFLVTQDWPDPLDINILPNQKYVHTNLARAFSIARGN